MAVDLGADAAARAIRDGVPLLQAGRLALDPEEVRDELRRVARDLAETTEPGTAAQRTAEVLATAPIDVEPLLGPVLDDDPAGVEREAFRLGLDPTGLSDLVGLALQPFLWAAAARLATLTDVDKWDRGYCPVCGAWPALAELVGPEKRRVLRCVRCGTGWSWFILLCPYCGNDDHRSLRVLHEEGTTERVDACERCHGYVKAIGSYTSASPALLVAEDIATADLDIAAASAGYRRPGDVDVATAGIPRLVREGRALRPPEGGPA